MGSPLSPTPLEKGPTSRRGFWESNTQNPRRGATARSYALANAVRSPDASLLDLVQTLLTLLLVLDLLALLDLGRCRRLAVVSRRRRDVGGVAWGNENALGGPMPIVQWAGVGRLGMVPAVSEGTGGEDRANHAVARHPFQFRPRGNREDDEDGPTWGDPPVSGVGAARWCEVCSVE